MSRELMANGCVNNRFPTIFTAKCIFIWVIFEYEGRIYIGEPEGYFYTVGWYHYSRE